MLLGFHIVVTGLSLTTSYLMNKKKNKKIIEEGYTFNEEKTPSKIEGILMNVIKSSLPLSNIIMMLSDIFDFNEHYDEYKKRLLDEKIITKSNKKIENKVNNIVSFNKKQNIYVDPFLERAKEIYSYFVGDIENTKKITDLVSNYLYEMINAKNNDEKDNIVNNYFNYIEKLIYESDMDISINNYKIKSL